MAKNKDPYEGWTHEDFEKEAEELRSRMNKSIKSINKKYKNGQMPDMDRPLSYIKKDRG